MSTILVVDDAPICRELLAQAFLRAGHKVVQAGDGSAAMNTVLTTRVDLIILDLSMPQVDGFSFLQAFRTHDSVHQAPVLVLTSVVDRDQVLRCSRLKVSGYVLKSSSILPDVLKRVGQLLESVPATPPAVPRLLPDSRGEAECATPNPTPAAVNRPTITNRIPRAAVLAAVQDAAAVKAMKGMAGSVAQIVNLTGAVKGSAADLAMAFRRDPVLAARAIQSVNDGSASDSLKATTVEEAVRRLGPDKAKDIAMSCGIVETFPVNAADGAVLARCWQHAIAVATLTRQIVPRNDAVTPGVAYLTGLCHDLGEIFLRQKYPDDFAAAVDCSAETGEPLNYTASIIFGISPEEVSACLLEAMCFPPIVLRGLREFAGCATDRAKTEVHPVSQLATALRIANQYANGLLLASGAGSELATPTQSDCRTAMILQPELDDVAFKSEIITTVSMLANAPTAEEAELARPLLPQARITIWYARHNSFSRPDPIEAALGSLARVEVKDRLPNNAAEAERCQAMVIASPSAETAGFRLSALPQLVPWFAKSSGGASNSIPLGSARLLYLTPDTKTTLAVPAGVQVSCYPVSLTNLYDFVKFLAPKWT